MKNLAFLLLIAMLAGICRPLQGQIAQGDTLMKRFSASPFWEPWDQGSFTFNGWQFTPEQSNWTIQTTQGNPPPTSVFNGSPTILNYNVVLESPTIFGNPWICAIMTLEFDIKLSDISAAGTEILTAEYYLNQTWHPVFEMTNIGSGEWVHHKIDISQCAGRSFKIGFRASGINSSNIVGWSIDNIGVNAVCKGPTACDYSISGRTVQLFWQEPDCDSLQNLMGYNIYRNQWAPAPLRKINATPVVVSTEYFDLLPATDTCSIYYYLVTAIHQDPITHILLCEAPCDTLLVDLSLGIETAGIDGTRVFPNPANDLLTIQSVSPVRSAELLDFTGQRLLHLDDLMKTEINVQVAGIPSGIYLIRINNRSGTILKKVSVIH